MSKAGKSGDTGKSGDSIPNPHFARILLQEDKFYFCLYIQGVCILHSHSLQPSFLYEMVNEGYLEAMGTRRFVQHAFFQSHFHLDIH
jgi:hypothetical protein